MLASPALFPIPPTANASAARGGTPHDTIDVGGVVLAPEVGPFVVPAVRTREKHQARMHAQVQRLFIYVRVPII